MVQRFLPNEADAFHDNQAEPDSVDFEIILAGIGRTGVLSGCAVTESSPAAQTVDVAVGEVVETGEQITVAVQADVAVSAADGSNPRIDLITVNGSGTVVVTAGTAAAQPVLPAIPASSVPLAALYIPTSDNTHANEQITDKRVFVVDRYVFNVKDFGAVGDGAADDTAAIQACVDAAMDAPVTVGIAGGDIYFPPGQYQISDAIVFDRFTGIIRGAGAGTPPDWVGGQSSHNSVIEWAGDNATPMFLLLDSRHVTIEELRFQGNETNPPTYGIECKAETGDNKGTNVSLSFRNLVIGEYPFTLGDAGHVDNGVGFTGLNQNNAQFYMNRVYIRAVNIGLHMPNSQTAWASVRDCVFRACAIGVETNARIYLSNPAFQTCALDLNITGGTTHITHINSENTGKFANVPDDGGLVIESGQIQCQNIITGGNVFIDASPSNSQLLIFREVELTNMTDAALCTIDFGPAQGSSDVGRFYFLVEHCTGWDPAQLNSTDDFWAQAPESVGVIEWSSYTPGSILHQFRNELRGRTNLAAGERDAIDITVWDLPHGTAQLGWQPPTYTDAARPGGADVVAGTVIWNSDHSIPNWSDGANWINISRATEESGAVTLDWEDAVVNVDTAGGTVVVTLPDNAAFDGKSYLIRRDGGNTVTIDRAGSDTFDDADVQKTLDSDGAAIGIFSIGDGEWKIVGTEGTVGGS